MKYPWFKRGGWFYYPTSVPGTILTAAGLAFCLMVFLAVDRRSHSASDTLFGIFPYFAGVFLLVDWIASRTNTAAD